MKHLLICKDFSIEGHTAIPFAMIQAVGPRSITLFGQSEGLSITLDYNPDEYILNIEWLQTATTHEELKTKREDLKNYDPCCIYAYIVKELNDYHEALLGLEEASSKVVCIGRQNS